MDPRPAEVSSLKSRGMRNLPKLKSFTPDPKLRSHSLKELPQGDGNGCLEEHKASSRADAGLHAQPCCKGQLLALQLLVARRNGSRSR